MISKIQDTLTAILRPALGVQDAVIPQGICASEWTELYELAVRHNVQGLMQESVASAPEALIADLPVDIAARLLSDSMTIASTHMAHRAAAGRLAAIWVENGVEARMVKGLESAKFYPCPEARVLGDIDWNIVRPEDWSKALEVVRSMGLKPEKDSDGDVHFEYDGIVVELHHKNRTLGDPQGRLELLGAHILHHAVVFGAEFRQVCDYAVAKKSLGVSVTDAGCRRWWAVLDNIYDYIINGAALSQDAARFLSITFDGATAASRASYFLRIAPGQYISRLAGLAIGRIKRTINN